MLGIIHNLLKHSIYVCLSMFDIIELLVDVGICLALFRMITSEYLNLTKLFLSNRFLEVHKYHRRSYLIYTYLNKMVLPCRYEI